MVPTRFDDRLRTALRQPESRLSARCCKWRQIVDLLAQGCSSHPDRDLIEAVQWLKDHHEEMPEDLLRELSRTFRGIPVPDAVLPFVAAPIATTRKPAAAAVAPSRGASAPLNGVEQEPADRQKGHATGGNGSGPAPVPCETGRPSDAPIFFPAAAAGDARSPRRSVGVTMFDDARRSGAKSAFTVRRVPREQMKTLIAGAVRPRTGDVVLARVDRILSQTRLELPCGRKAALHRGDEIIVAYGDRYATDHLESRVPLDLGPTNLVATGGVASEMLSRTSGVRSATHITPIGLIGDAAGMPLNLCQFALEEVVRPKRRPKIVAVLGTGMNSGKTTTNRYLVAGLSRAGLRPGAAKITGTGSGGDYWVMSDAGAHRVLDFTDAGYSSTYRVPVEEIEAAARKLIDHLTQADCGVILLEVADGLYQEQNAELIRSEFFKRNVDGVFFAAGDALGAAAGLNELRTIGLPVLGVAGKLTASPLSIKEAERFLDAPVFGKPELSSPELAPQLVGIRPDSPTVDFAEAGPLRSPALPVDEKPPPHRVL